MLGRKKIILSFVALTMLIGSVVLAFGALGHDLHSTYAQQTVGVTVQDFYISASYDPWGTTFDSNGNVWLAIPGCDPSPTCSSNTPPGVIAKYNPGTKNWMATYQLPSGYAQPLFLAFDAQGRLWFPMPMDNSIGMLNPTKKTFKQWAIPTANAGPWDIAVDHNGMVWFTEHYTNQIGRFDPATQTFMEVPTPALNSQPYGIVVDASNNVWFTENNSSVALIGAYTSGISVDSNGLIWFDDSLQNIFGSFPDSGSGSFTLYNAPTTNGHPHDGLNVDGQNRIWFSEEFANKLAQAVQTGVPISTPTNGSSPSPTNTTVPSPTLTQ